MPNVAEGSLRTIRAVSSNQPFLEHARKVSECEQLQSDIGHDAYGFRLPPQDLFADASLGSAI
jgi:hypothetical protein